MSALEVRDLSKRFPIGGALRRSQVHAVEDVSFALRPGTITALVGESGSGKTTLARAIAGLLTPQRGGPPRPKPAGPMLDPRPRSALRRSGSAGGSGSRAGSPRDRGREYVLERAAA